MQTVETSAQWNAAEEVTNGTRSAPSRTTIAKFLSAIRKDENNFQTSNSRVSQGGPGQKEANTGRDVLQSKGIDFVRHMHPEFQLQCPISSTAIHCALRVRFIPFAPLRAVNG